MKLFSTLFILYFTTILSAQITKGKIMSEVGFNFSNSNYTYKNNRNANAAKDKFITFSINTTNRYFIKNNVYTSLVLGYSHSFNVRANLDSVGNQVGSDRYTNKNYNISIGLGALRSLTGKFYIGTDVNVGISTRSKQTFASSYTDGASNLQYFLNLKPQLYYHLKPKFLIFVDFGQVEYSYESDNYSYSFNSNFNLFFSPRFWNYGFIFLWGKSKEKTN